MLADVRQRDAPRYRARHRTDAWPGRCAERWIPHDGRGAGRAAAIDAVKAHHRARIGKSFADGFGVARAKGAYPFRGRRPGRCPVPLAKRRPRQPIGEYHDCSQDPFRRNLLRSAGAGRGACRDAVAGAAAAQRQQSYFGPASSIFVAAFLDVGALRTVYTGTPAADDPTKTEQQASLEEGQRPSRRRSTRSDGMDVELYAAILEQAARRFRISTAGITAPACRKAEEWLSRAAGRGMPNAPPAHRPLPIPRAWPL